MTYHYYCDRCDDFYETSDSWARRPLCSACLIGTRRAETVDAWPRLITSRELENAWRTTLFRQWGNQITA